MPWRSLPIPSDPEGGSVEVRTDIRRVGSRDGTIIFALLVPGVTEFFVDYRQPFEGETLDPMTPGRLPGERRDAAHGSWLPRSRSVRRGVGRLATAARPPRTPAKPVSCSDEPLAWF